MDLLSSLQNSKEIFKNGYSKETVDQVWTPDTDTVDVRFYQKKVDGTIIVVGFETNNPDYEKMDIDTLHALKVTESNGI